jgi:hypothetical protein
LRSSRRRSAATGGAASHEQKCLTVPHTADICKALVEGRFCAARQGAAKAETLDASRTSSSLHRESKLLIRRKSFPVKWTIFSLVALLASIGFYWWVAVRSIEWPRGGSLIGIIYGSIAAAIILFEMAIWPRKAWFRAVRLFGSAQGWLWAHIALGLVSVPFAFLHTGFHFGGQLTIGLMTLFVIVILSGIVGLMLQNIIPKVLLDEIPSETIHAQIEHVSRRLAYDAEDMVLAICGPDPPEMPDRSKLHFGERDRVEAGGVVTRTRRVGGLRGVAVESRRITGRLEDGRILRDAFYDVIVDYLLKGKRGESKLVDATYSSRYFADLSASVDDAAETIDSLEDMCRQRREFDKQKKWFFLLHSWLWLHLPFSVALSVALIAHVVVALKYL